MTELLVGLGYGRRVGLRVPADDVDAVRANLPFWWVEDAGEPERVRDTGAGAPPERAVRELELWVAEHAVGCVFVHAGAVAVDGRALLLPGRSGSGKTTLTAALLRAGADYLSDEYAVLDPAGQVHPYPRPLAVRSPAGRTGVPAGEFGARTATGPTPVAAVALLAHVPGGRWAPQSLTPGAAVLRLLDNTVSARSRPQESLDAVLAALRLAPAIEGERGGADEAAVQLLALLSDA